MRGNFLQLRNFLLHHHPSSTFEIQGENYPPPPYAMFLVTVVGYCQMATMLLMLGGRWIFSFVGFAEPPQWYTHISENKLQTFAFILLANTLAASLTATGAFEVTYDGMVVFSKLETGRLPTGDEILSGLRALGVE